ncbi:hypothetical protein LX36DRAFT_75515 [Colletotrichum falcatum]|nr:hypothetical protein LX36DRAFT_75515 [Colletotrichum falcatum]
MMPTSFPIPPPTTWQYYHRDRGRLLCRFVTREAALQSLLGGRRRRRWRLKAVFGCPDCRLSLSLSLSFTHTLSLSLCGLAFECSDTTHCLAFFICTK